MASILKAAQDVLDTARDGIGWIALWKVGRSWYAEDFYVDYKDSENTFTFNRDDYDRLTEITNEDANALFLNSYYMNLGDPEEMTAGSLANALRWHYEEKGGANLKGFLRWATVIAE